MSVLSYDKEALARLCRRHRIRRLALFGSVLKGSDRPDSDVDFLAEFEPNAVPGLLGLAAIEAELSGLLGRPVDLRTAQELSPHFRRGVERTAEVQFAAPEDRIRLLHMIEAAGAGHERGERVMAPRRSNQLAIISPWGMDSAINPFAPT